MIQNHIHFIVLGSKQCKKVVGVRIGVSLHVSFWPFCVNQGVKKNELKSLKTRTSILFKQV